MAVPVETAAVVLGCVYAIVFGVLRWLTPGGRAVAISGAVVPGYVRVSDGVVLGGASEGGDRDVGAGGAVSLLCWLVKQLLILIVAIGILEEVLLIGARCSPASVVRLHQLNPIEQEITY